MSEQRLRYLSAGPVERRDAVATQSRTLTQKTSSVADRMASWLALTFIPWDPMPAALFDLDREQPQARHCE